LQTPLERVAELIVNDYASQEAHHDRTEEGI
jgi:hypothetical protein